MRWLLLLIIPFVVGCDPLAEHPENIIGSTSMPHSLEGEVIDHYTKEVIHEGNPRYVLVWTDGEREELNGHYYKSIDSICKLYCN